jgi:hypothetical protein
MDSKGQSRRGSFIVGRQFTEIPVKDDQEFRLMSLDYFSEKSKRRPFDQRSRKSPIKKRQSHHFWDRDHAQSFGTAE